MSTLGIMKERIASELRRGDLSTASEFRSIAQVSDIHDAIMSAIECYQHRRFWWNESRSLTFSTVAEQDIYDEDDDEDIPRVLKFDYVIITIGGQPFELFPIQPLEAELSNGPNASRGQPIYYSYYGRQLRLTPIPSEDDWIVRAGALLSMPAPASDGEANNVWMNEAERLIRSHAKMELYLHVIKDLAEANTMRAVMEDALARAVHRTNQLTQVGDGCVEAWG